MGNIVQSSSLEALPLGAIASYALATVLLALLVQLVLQVVTQTRLRFKHAKLLEKIPGPPLHWFWGSAGEIRNPGDVIRICYEWTEQYGPIRRSRLGPFKYEMVLCEPEAVKAVMNTSDPKEPQLYGFLKPWIGDGLLLSYGQKWMRNRRLLTPAFHFEILKPYVDIFSSSTQVMVKKWKNLLNEKEGSLEMFEHVSLMMLDSLLKCTFGYESHCQTESRKSPYIQAVYDLTALVVERITRPMLHIPLFYYLSPSGFRFWKACHLVHEYSRSVIKARKEAIHSRGKGNAVNTKEKKYLDFLDILLQARDEDGKGLTDEEIQHEVDTFMFEGHDTTASGLSWFLYNMARYPEHQDKCREEVLDVLGDDDAISWDDLHNLPYLTLCIKESLRIHPPVPNIARRVENPTKLPNSITLPKGIWVSLSIFSMHHNPAVWEDPERYDPLRFTPENTKGRSTHAFVPFSAGPRNCIGQNFAMNELKVCASLLLKHFRFAVDPAVPIVLWPELILRSKDGVWLKVTPLP